MQKVKTMGIGRSGYIGYYGKHMRRSAKDKNHY